MLVAPYELGRLRDGVGRGPEHLLAAGAEDVLAANGAHVRRELIEIDDRFTQTGLGDEDAGFELIRRVASVYAEPGGLDGDQLVAAVTALLDRFAVRAVSLASYDPGYDTEDRVPPIALRLLRAVADRI